MIETVLLGFAAFAGTNMDDLLMNILFFAKATTLAEERKIWLGKHLGMAVLLSISLLGAAGVQLLPQKVIGLLGFLPIILGIREMISGRKCSADTEGSPPSVVTHMLLNTAAITAANGADNIGMYVPLFAGYAPWQTVVTILIFIVLVSAWCYLGKLLSGLPLIENTLVKYRKILVPVVYVALGVYILMKNFCG